MNESEILFYLIKNAVFDAPLPENFDTSFDRAKLFALAKKHDAAHLLSWSLGKNGLLPESGKYREVLEDETGLAVYRETQLTFLCDLVRETLSEAKIDFIPLKGAVIRDMYPRPWMRTSCDVDVLVKEEDLKRATDALVKKGFTTDNVLNYHDVSLYLDETHLELHYSIREDDPKLDPVLSEVWEHVEKVGEYEYRESAEFFVFHHIAHMAYHVMGGGCGIRPFIDFKILKDKGIYDEEKLLPLLKKSSLVRFYETVKKLTEIWLGDGSAEKDETAEKLGNFVLFGGVYGNSENNISMGLAKNEKSKIKYLLRLAFPPFETMCFIYPSLKKRKILLPFYYINRFFRKIFGKDRKRVRKRIKNTARSDVSSAESAETLLRDLGLKS